MSFRVTNGLLKKTINIKIEYDANENPLNNSEKNNICLSKVNVSNNQQKKSYNANFKNKCLLVAEN